MVRLKCLTLNMQNGQVWDAKNPDEAPIEIERTAQFLREQNADLVFLQELEFPESDFPDKSLHPNYDYLRKALEGYHTCFAYPAATRAHLPFGIGLTIFSRHQLRDPFHVVLPAALISFDYRGRDYEPAERSLIGAWIDVDGRSIRLLNTHLQAYFMINASSDVYPEQRQVLASVLTGSDEPTILGGDFNCASSENTVSFIENYGYKTVQNKTITWHRMPFVLDHIFFSKHFILTKGEVVNTFVSDHNAVSAVLHLDLP